MAVDFFLKIDGIPGESHDDKHKDEIDVLSWSWGASNTGTFQQGGGGGAGKVAMQDFHFTMKMNKASPLLFQACASGKHIPKAVFTARKAGEGQKDYLFITFSDFLISSYSTGGAEEPHENISLNFAKVEVEYKMQAKDGSVGPGIKKGYDVKANKMV